MGYRTCFKYTPEEDETLRRMQSEGYTVREIAEAMGREDNAIKCRIKRVLHEKPLYFRKKFKHERCGAKNANS